MLLKRISLEDWCGWYLDGKLIQQGHSTNESALLDVLAEKFGFKFESKYIEDENDLNEFGNSLPEKLEEIEEYIVRNKL